MNDTDRNPLYPRTPEEIERFFVETCHDTGFKKRYRELQRFVKFTQIDDFRDPSIQFHINELTDIAMEIAKKKHPGHEYSRIRTLIQMNVSYTLEKLTPQY